MRGQVALVVWFGKDAREEGMTWNKGRVTHKFLIGINMILQSSKERVARCLQCCNTMLSHTIYARMLGRRTLLHDSIESKEKMCNFYIRHCIVCGPQVIQYIN